MTSEHPNLPDVAASLRADRAQRQAHIPGWLVALLLWWLALRVAGWVARDADPDVWMLAGVAGDTALVSALFSLSGASVLPRFFLAIAAFSRVIDLAHAAIDQAHFTVSAWGHVSLDLWRLLLEGGAVLVVSLAAGSAWFAWRAAKYAKPLSTSAAIRWLALAVVMSCGHWLAFPNPMHNALMPEINLVRTLHARATGPADLGLRALPFAERQQCADMFPIATALAPSDTAATDLPQVGVSHVVVVFVESLDRRWLDSAPELSKRLQDGGFVLFNGYYTQARPTQFGLVASLCSLLPGTWPFDTRSDTKVPARPCLPGHVHQQLGMKPIFIHGGYNRYTGLGTTLRQLGFDDVRGRKQIDPNELAQSSNPFGLHDHDVFADAIDQLERAESLQERRFIAIGTADSHYPGYVPASAHSTAAQTGDQRAGERMADAMSHALEQVQWFTTTLRDKGLLDKTLLVITADHSSHASEGGRLFGELALAIRHPDVVGPGHKRTFGGQLDLAPTILQSLDLRPRPDLFAGRSLWSQTADDRTLWGITGRRIARITRSGERVFALAQLEASCRTGGTCGPIRCLNHLDGYWYGRHEL